MEELKIFIGDLLDTLGLGVGGHIKSYNYDQAKDLFAKYTIVVNGNTVYFSKDGKPILYITYDTNEKGIIKGYEIKC
jgi:hypothetical protein